MEVDQSKRQLVWLVTGCSSGIGYHMIRAIIERGDRAIATARDVSSLEDLKSLGAAILELDVTAAADYQQITIQRAISYFGRVDVLVQNAGFGMYGPIEELNEGSIHDIYTTNIFGPIRLLKAIMPHWRERKFGRHVLLSFLDAISGMAGYGAYCSSKAAVTRLFESFNEEAVPLGFVKNLIVEPGLFRTPFHSKLRFPTDSAHYQWLADEARKSIHEITGKQPGDPAKLANVILDIIRKEGPAADKGDVVTLPLGRDAFEEMKRNAEQTLEQLNKWEDVIKSTDYDDL